MKTLSVIIPALNEAKGIQKTVQTIPYSELNNMGYQVQVLVIDGDSKDGTRELAKEAGAQVIVEPRRGYGQAYKTGFANAKGDIIVTADADGTYPMEDIARLVAILEAEKLDFLTTNRFAFMEERAMSARNKIGNTILNLAVMALFRLKIKDSQSGMWVFRKDILSSLVLKSNTPLSQEIKIEACYFNKMRWKEVPIGYYSRLDKAKLGGWKVGMVNLLQVFKKRLVR